jgi:hypothetical protein
MKKRNVKSGVEANMLGGGSYKGENLHRALTMTPGMTTDREG